MSVLMDPGLDPVYLYNGGCARCGTGSPLYDIDVQIPYEGILALCPGCITDVANTAGMIVNEQGASLLAAALAKAEEMEARALAAEDIVARVKAASVRKAVK